MIESEKKKIKIKCDLSHAEQLLNVLLLLLLLL